MLLEPRTAAPGALLRWVRQAWQLLWRGLGFWVGLVLLMCLWRHQWWARFLDCFSALYGTYLAHVTWEPAAELQKRVAHLLPGLFLARVDGKSPVEYITSEVDRDKVRRVALQLLHHPADLLSHISEAWRAEIGLGGQQLRGATPPNPSEGP
jgi:hypothetical protein